MRMREEQAYNDGRMAYRERGDVAACPRRSGPQRAAWMRGFERERQMDRGTKATPEQRQESSEVIKRLRDFVEGLAFEVTDEKP